MRELAQHITDLVENSVRAGARRVDIELQEDLVDNWLTVRVVDDGKGMGPDLLARAVDPFWTTRTCRRVGLGLPLLAAAAERCEGSLEIASEPGCGTQVKTRFRHGHIDRPPLGDLHATLLAALVGHPEVEVHYHHRVDGRDFELDGGVIRRELQGVSLSHPPVLRWLERYIDEGLAEVGLQPTSIEEESDAEAD